MPRAQFSIKWKAVFFLSLILLAITVAMVGLYAITLLQAYEEQAKELNKQQDHVFHSLLQEANDEQVQLATLIPSLANINTAIIERDDRALVEALRPHWLNLSLNLNINYLYIFDESGQRVGGIHNREEVAAEELAQISQLATTAGINTAPASVLSCTTQCTLYVVEPFMLTRDIRGVIVIGRNISELVVSFQNLSGSDLGVFIQSGAHSNNRDRVLKAWSLDVWALSNFNVLVNVVRGIQLQSSVPTDFVYHGQDGQSYRSHVIGLDGVEVINEPPLLMAFDNATATDELLKSTINNGVMIGAAGWFIAELLLILLIAKPSQRLARITRALPLLAENEFSKARHNISPRNTWFSDELDILEQTTLTVCGELETLNQQVVENTEKLEQQMVLQTRAREFVSRLLDTAPLIILTQSLDGQINLMNRWGRQVMGALDASASELPDFRSLHIVNTIPEDLLQRFNALGDKRHVRYQHEAQLKDNKGGLHYVTWLHTRVENEAHEPMILSVGMDLTERVEAENKLSWLATHDTLTGLQNRRSFQDHLSRLLRRGGRGALLFIDSDRFKYINDTAGHNVGDQVLVHISRLLEKHTRDTDIVARLGGDEFVILLPRANAETARVVMSKLADMLNTSLTLPNGALQHFSCSLGGALYPDHGGTDEELLAAADMAMYTAKQQGSGHWHLYDASRALIDRMQTDLTWQEKIRLALSDDLFRLFFQPIWDINQKSVSHYEVLLRMQVGDKLVTPNEFIPVAERTGLIGDIDFWVLEESMKFLAGYNGANQHAPISLAVNVSAPSIQSPDFDHAFFDLCEKHAVPPESIVIEITETAFLSEFQSAQQTLEKLADSGCRIALDDFGVGFSSFSYLKQMPLSYVKMDGSYVRDLETKPQEQTFVRCLTEMVSGFEMTTIAEFVETAETLHTLKTLGVKYAQGYLIGKPEPTIRTSAEIYDEIYEVIEDTAE